MKMLPRRLIILALFAILLVVPKDSLALLLFHPGDLQPHSDSSRRVRPSMTPHRSCHRVGGGGACYPPSSCCWQKRNHQPTTSTTALNVRNEGSNDDSNDDSKFLTSAAATTGLVAQPIVWFSLYLVATTGAGLPAGPWGLMGALEGVSYLVVVGFVAVSVYRRIITIGSSPNSNPPTRKNGRMELAERLAYLTLVAGLLALSSLVADQGCVPNAKPILDYSDYLPVCEAQAGGEST